MNRNELKEAVIKLAASIDKLIASTDIIDHNSDFSDYYVNYSAVAKLKLIENDVNKTKSYLGKLYYIYDAVKTDNYE
jgi:hypothetical protein